MEGAILRSRTGRFTGDADREFAKLGRILRGSCHGWDSLLQDQVVLGTEPPSNPGRFNSAAPLKPVGRQLVQALDQAPLLLDLAHLNDAGFYEVLDLYSSPVLVTHSFCRAIGDHPRGLTDEQLRALGGHGGLVGLAFDPDFLGEASTGAALRHIDRIASLAGENAVSIGSDWGVTAMGELGDPASLVGLVNAVGRIYGSELAEKFAFTNAYDFLGTQLPRGQ